MADDKGKTAMVVAGGGLAGVVAALLVARKAAAKKDGVILDEETMNLLIAMAQSIDSLQSQTAALAEALEAAGIEVKVMPENIREIRIERDVLATQGIILTQPPPFDGYIREVKIHWPPGCAGLVSVRVGYSTRQFCPFEGFLALDNVTPTYPFNEYVQHTENLWVEIQNADEDNDHRITVMLNLTEKI